MDYKALLYKGDLTFFVCLATMIILPVYVHILPPFMFIWGIFWFWQNNFRITKSMFLDNKSGILFILFVAFFLWQIIGLVICDSLDSGFERIIKRLSFIIFPMVLFYPGNRILKNANLLIRYFAIFTFIFIVFCFSKSLYNSIVIKGGIWVFNPHPPDVLWENYFYGYRLSDPVHPSYLSMYILLSILISAESVINDTSTILKKCFWSFLLIVFFIALYFLSSRAGILTIILISPAYIYFRFRKKMSKWIVLSFLILSIIAIFCIAKTNYRISYTIKSISKSAVNESIEKDIRYNIWNSALGVSSRHLILGVGTGDASNELKKEFLKRGYTEGYYDTLNAHNQYLEILLENGLVGLILFLCIIGYMIFIAISDRNLIYGLFILITCIFFVFETILNRLSGITYFPLFSFLLIYLNRDIGQEESKN